VPAVPPDWAWPNDLRIGFHLSIGAGSAEIFRRYRLRGCGALQIFVASPRVWQAVPWKTDKLECFCRERAVAGTPPLVVHARYLLNLASLDATVRERSIEVLRFEYQAAAACDADVVVLHMGINPDRDAGLDLMIRNLRRSLDGLAGKRPLLLLENTAGERNDLGGTFADMARVRDALPFPTGICLDTCHAFQAGHDLRTPAGRAALVRECGAAFGPDGVRVIHLNDSLNPCGGRHDRHAGIGLGHIGADALAAFLTMPAWRGLPVILETPKAGDDDPTADLDNLRRLAAGFSRVRDPKG